MMMTKFYRLIYAADTGLFFWAKSGLPAGSIDAKGYCVIRYGSKNYKAHRLAWFITHGTWPARHIDHINGVRSDNRIANLRDAGLNVNAQNQRKKHTNNKSGFLGVCWNKNAKKWQAQIKVHGKVKYLGLFEHADIASKVYLETKRALHEGCTL